LRLKWETDMRLRNLLAATAASALIIGAVGVPAQSVPAPSLADAGSLFTWGDEEDSNAGPAITIPGDITGPVRSVATNGRATGIVTADGAVRVWGATTPSEVPGEPPLPIPEVDGAPTGVTDAAAITLAFSHGAILHTDGRVTAWGGFGPAFSEVPSDLRAKAISIMLSGTGYAVRTDGTLATWGNPPFNVTPPGLTNLVDVVATTGHVLALRSDGTVVGWNPSGGPGPLDVPDFGGKKVVNIAASGAYSAAAFEDGTIEIWGDPGSIPEGEPTFDGLTPATKVTSLAVGGMTGEILAAVTADGAVHVWGTENPVADVPPSLAGQPVSAIAVGNAHMAAIVTTFRELAKPTIAGQPKVGQTLTATPATFSLAPDAAATGQWYAGSDPISGKTATTLALDPSLVGKAVSYRTTATRGDQTLVSASAATAPVAAATTPPVAKAPSKVSGKVKATGKTKKIAKKVTIAITVKTAKGVSPAGKVTVTLKGKTKKKVTVKVNAKGKATATFKKVKRGKYTATLKYTGNAKVKASTGKAKFKA
jgi:WD40 repeat protein